LDFSYLMLFGHPWLRDAKVIHDWGTNIITIQGIGIVKTIPITKKLSIQTKRPEVLVCCDFHSGISNDKEDVMFVIELHLFSIGTIIIPTHIEHIPKPICLLYIIMAKLILNQPIILANVLAMKLVVPPNIAKQHSLETFFHP